MRVHYVLSWLLLWQVATVHGDAKPTVEVHVSGSGESHILHAMPAPGQEKMISKTLDEAKGLKVITANPADACSPLKNSVDGGDFAVLVERGTCTFVEKIHAAEKIGASAILVGDTLQSLYEVNGTKALPSLKVSAGGPCLLRCDISTSIIPSPAPSANEIYSGLQGSACAASCPSGMCGLTGEHSEAGYTACCLPDKYQQMSLGKDEKIKIPAVFLGASDATRLQQDVARGNNTIKMTNIGQEYGWLISAILIWVLGCGVEILSTWNSARSERAALNGTAPPPSERKAMAQEESLDMTIQTALCYLLTASVGLVGLFLLIQQDARYVVFFMIFVFSMAVTSVMTALGTYPVVHHMFPTLDKKPFSIPHVCHVTQAWALGFAISLSLVVTWVVNRHSPYAWILQDTFAVFVCCQFVLALRMNSIKVSSVLLVSFMVYDIFMVFISPLIFKSSVMVTVAQAGSGTTTIDPTNPYKCLRVPTERMPMLFMLPRLGSDGEYAMLGLGDVLLPGLLLSFMMRLDVLSQREVTAEGCCFGPLRRFRQRYPYWSLGVVGYCFGLFLAFLANTFGFTIFEVKGQPALLYLVPCTLGPLSLYACMRGELQAMWDGPEILTAPLPVPAEKTTLV